MEFDAAVVYPVVIVVGVAGIEESITLKGRLVGVGRARLVVLVVRDTVAVADGGGGPIQGSNSASMVCK
jgi:hypothetical protein